MGTKEKFLQLLNEANGDYVSGEKAAKSLSVSRNAIWKAAKSLEAEGVHISSSLKKGYRLEESYDLLTEEGVTFLLPQELKDRLKVSVIEKTSSTNEVLKEAAQKGEAEGAVLIALQQSKGKGRLGRSFFSPKESGLYLSILLRPKFNASRALFITTAAAVAVAESAESISNKKCGIKWVNDVFVEDKKLCGILTEASVDLETQTLSHAILGIGLNVYEPKGGFPEEIKSIACALFSHQRSGLKAQIAAEIIKRFFTLYDGMENQGVPDFVAEYKKRSILNGRPIKVLRGGTETNAVALEIDDECRLKVKLYTGETINLFSGDVSIVLCLKEEGAEGEA